MFRTTCLLVLFLLTAGLASAQGATTPPPPPSAVYAALEDLNAMLGTEYTLDDLGIDGWSWEETEFSDASLGCPQPEMFYAQVITPGYVILFTVDGTTYDYRATIDGRTLMMCRNYGAPAPELDAQTSSLAANSLLTATRIAEVTAEAYPGEQTGSMVVSPTGVTLTTLALPDANGMSGVLVYQTDAITTRPVRYQPLEQITAMAYQRLDTVTYLTVGDRSGTVIYFPVEPEGGRHLIPMQQEQNMGPVNALAVGPDASWIAGGYGDASIDGVVRLWNEGAIEAKIETGGPVSALAFSPDGLWLAFGRSDGALGVIDVTNLDNPPLVMTAHNGSLDALAFSADGLWLASGGEDGTTVLWTLGGTPDLWGAAATLPTNEGGPVQTLAFDPAATVLITAGGDSSADYDLRVWNVSDGALVGRLSGHEAPVRSVGFSPDGRLLFSADEAGTLFAWQVSA